MKEKKQPANRKIRGLFYFLIMGFDICFNAGENAVAPQAMSAKLLEQFDHLKFLLIEISEEDTILWEIDAVEGHLADVIITGWPNSIFLEIHSTPLVSCASELQQVQPVIDFLLACGYLLETENGLLEDYAQQYQRVEQMLFMLNEE